MVIFFRTYGSYSPALIPRHRARGDACIQPRGLLQDNPRSQDHLRLRRAACRRALGAQRASQELRPLLTQDDHVWRGATDKRAGRCGVQEIKDQGQPGLRAERDESDDAYAGMGNALL
jgi:hypothetical protein